MRFTYTQLSGSCERDLRNCMICTYRLVVTVAISGVDFLGLHAGKSVTVHNYPWWVALHVMKMEDY